VVGRSKSRILTGIPSSSSNRVSDSRREPCGATASVLFVGVFVLEDLLSPGFNWLSTAASEHSIGPHGWIQISTFVVTGLLLLAFASGVAREFGRDGSMLGPRSLAILGWCILLSGPFVAHPAPVAVYSREATWHGIVHGILGAVAFTLMPASCFVFYRRFRKDRLNMTPQH
jgi:Protein of unknown function (DUF998)